MPKKNKLKIGIVGCGAIGSSLAKEIVTNFGSCATLTALYDIRTERAQLLSRSLTKDTSLSVANLDILIKKSDQIGRAHV